MTQQVPPCMLKIENYRRGFAHKYGGTSVVTKDQDLEIIARTVEHFKRTPSDGYSFLITSGLGSLGNGKAIWEKKITDLMVQSASTRSFDLAWAIAKGRAQKNLYDHGIPQILLKDQIDGIESDLRSGNTDERTLAHMMGFGEIAKENTFITLGKHLHPEINWHRMRVPLLIAKELESGQRTNLPISHRETLEHIRKYARIEELQGKITVGAGFTANLSDQKIGKLATTFRGGSDASLAYALAALDLDEGVIFSDREGIYPVDPRLIPRSVPLKELTYREAKLFAGLGASIIQQVAIEPARERKSRLFVGMSNGNGASGTLIGGQPSFENYGVKAIAVDKGHTFVYVTNMNEQPGEAARVQAIFASNGYNIAHEIDGDDFRAYAVKRKENFHLLLKELSDPGYTIVTRTPIDRVVLVGEGMELVEQHRTGASARQILSSTLDDLGIRPIAYLDARYSCSKSVFVEGKDRQILLERLADNFGFYDRN
ncbi:aspartate kinase [archaeon]|jgi:aspartate kinase|nr:aspartate kinase [archaeon]MBT6762622.1 aspartate kinase [archaeon]